MRGKCLVTIFPVPYNKTVSAMQKLPGGRRKSMTTGVAVALFAFGGMALIAVIIAIVSAISAVIGIDKPGDIPDDLRD